MSENKKTEIQRLEILRLSNEESNHITKMCLESALILLLKDKCFENISITDIVNRAGVSRTAYYRNYKSKEDILYRMMHEVIDNVFDTMNLHIPIENTQEYWYGLFYAVKQHSDIFLVLLKANFGDTILHEIYKKMLDYVPQANAQSTYQSFFWSGAMYSVLAAWLRDGMKLTVEEMAVICYNIIKGMGDCNCLDL